METDDDGNTTEVYPARVSYRGFSQETEELGFAGLTHYLSAEIEDLVCETVMPTEEDGDVDDNLWESPAAVALIEAMEYGAMKKDIEIGRRFDHINFCPKLFATYKGELLFEFSAELIQDIKFGGWSGFISGKPDPIRSDEYVANEIIQMCINDKPEFEKQIKIAFQMLLEDRANRLKEFPTLR